MNNSIIEHETSLDIPEKLDLGGKVLAVAVAPVLGGPWTDKGKVWAWSESNAHGQLGRGDFEASDWQKGEVQFDLPDGVSITQLAAGESHALALRNDGKVMAWGHNEAGELGDGSTTDQAAPIEVPDLTDVIAIAAGVGPNGQGTVDGGWSMALKSNGDLWGWGANTAGEILTTDPEQAPYYTTPQQIPVADIDSVSITGQANGYAVAADGTAWSWGDWLYGALGNGQCGLGQPFSPVQVVDHAGTGLLEHVTAAAGGGGFALALLADGTVWGWGYNESAAIGDGTTGETVNCNSEMTESPSTVVTPSQALNVTTAIAIAAGDDQSLVLLEDGTVWAAGYNANDKLGVGDDAPTLPDTADVGVFTQVPGL